LVDDLNNRYLPGILRQCPSLTQYHPNKLAAILDFTYNLGIGRLQTSTLRRRINQHDWPACAYELQRWVFCKGRKLAGLVKRRQAEALLILAPHD